MLLPGLSQTHEVSPEAWESRGEAGSVAGVRRGCRLAARWPLSTDMFCLAHTVFEKYSKQFEMWEVFVFSLLLLLF